MISFVSLLRSLRFACLPAGRFAIILVITTVFITITHADMNDGLVGHWGFDEGSGVIATDVSLGNNGTLLNGSTWSTGKVGSGAVQFDGVDDYIKVPNSSALDITEGSSAITVSFWVKKLRSADTVFQYVSRTDGILGRAFTVSSDAYFSLRPNWRYGGFGTGGSNLDHACSTCDIPLNQWTHVVAMYNNPTSYIYINGVLKSQKTGSGGVTNTNINTPITMGVSNTLANPANYVMDDVRIYNRALTVDEISALCGQGSGGCPAATVTPTTPAAPTTPSTPTTPTVPGAPTIYTVKQDGTGHYTTIQACANVAKAGDTCLVYPGTYPEFVKVINGGASEETRVIFEGVSVNGQPSASIEGFDIRPPYVTVKNFLIEKPTRSSQFSISSAANYVQILNNTIRGNVGITSEDFIFRDNGVNDDTITTQTGNFVEAGFKPGMSFYIYSTYTDRVDGNRNVQLLSRNIGTKTVKAVSEHTLTIADGESLDNQGPVYAYVAFIPWFQFYFLNEKDVAANGALIRGNKIEDSNTDIVFLLNGKNHVIENNEISGTKGGDIFRPSGEGHIMRGNYVHDTVRVNGFPEHPDIFQAWQNVRNITVEKNFFMNFEPDAGGAGQIGMLSTCATGQDGCVAKVGGAIFRNNVFFNISHIFFGQIPNIVFENNTFYMTGKNVEIHPLFFSKDANNPTIKNNIFLANRNAKRKFFGWYQVDPSFGGFTDYNYVAGPSPSYSPEPGNLYPNKFNEPHGINGGDPKFQNINDPLGPDGIPFTVDDGFKPLPGSPLCAKGEGGVDIGAHSCDANLVFASAVGLAGDVSGNGKVTMHDAALVLRYTLGAALSDAQKQKADMNADGKIDGSDVLAIGRKALGL